MVWMDLGVFNPIPDYARRGTTKALHPFVGEKVYRTFFLFQLTPLNGRELDDGLTGGIREGIGRHTYNRSAVPILRPCPLRGKVRMGVGFDLCGVAWMRLTPPLFSMPAVLLKIIAPEAMSLMGWMERLSLP
jgi:hypothetical protein